MKIQETHRGGCGSFLPILAFLLAGCCNSVPKNAWITKVGDQLEPVAQGVDYWGSASMSNPLLTTPLPQFKFDLTQSAQTYYNHARADINGGVANSTEESSQFKTGDAVQANIDTMVKAALAASTGGVAGLPSVLTPGPAPQISTNVLPTTLPASDVLSTAKFAAVQGLLSGNANILDDRTAIMLAAGDKSAQDILTYLAGPTTATQFKDKIVVFGTGMVSVQPGTHTSTDYAADLAVAASYIEVPARTEVLSKLKVSDRIELYKACLRENWKDALDAPKAVEACQKAVKNLGIGATEAEKGAAQHRLNEATTAQTSADGNYQAARQHYARSILYEVRILLQNSGVAIDTTPLYKDVFTKKDSPKTPNTAKNEPLGAKLDAPLPPGSITPPTQQQLVQFARDVDQLSADGNGKVQVFYSSATPDQIEFKSDNLKKLEELITQADCYNEVPFANTLRTALATLQEEVTDAKLLMAASEFANTDWPRIHETDSLGHPTYSPQFFSLKAKPLSGAQAADLPASDLVANQQPFSINLAPGTDLTSNHPALGSYSIGRMAGAFQYRSDQTGPDEYPDRTSASPYIAAVSPMSDSQVLDLRQSARKQQENATNLALALSFLGATDQSQAFLDYVKRQQTDVSTISPDNVQLAYSKGDQFGFQVSPRLKAVASVQNPNGGATRVLEPISFPVLVIIGIEQEDVRLFPWKNEDGIYVPGEKQIQLRQTTHWIPQHDPTDTSWFPDTRLPKRLTETERAAWAYHLTEARRIIDANAHGEDDTQDKESMSNRIDTLARMAVDDWDSQYVPASVIVQEYVPPAPSAAPIISDVSSPRIYVPAILPVTVPTMILGSGLKNVQAGDLTLVQPGISTPTITLDSTAFNVVCDGAIKLGLKVSAPITRPTNVYLKLTYTNDTGAKVALLTPPILLEDFNSQSQKIIRTTTKDGKGNSKDEFQFSPLATPTAIQQFLKALRPRQHVWPLWLSLREWWHDQYCARPSPPPPPPR